MVWRSSLVGNYIPHMRTVSVLRFRRLALLPENHTFTVFKGSTGHLDVLLHFVTKIQQCVQDPSYMGELERRMNCVVP